MTGLFYGELDPKDPHNTIINDIALAPVNAHGKVEYTGTFALAKPVDMSKSSGVLYYLVPNRGNGSPVLYPEGHVTVVSGWQGDLPPRSGTQYLTVPIARNRDGSSITGPVIQRIIDVPAGQNTVDLRTRQYSGLSYQFPATLDTSRARLTRRRANAEPATVPPAEWAFADCAATPFPGVPDQSHLCLKSGFDPAAEYLLQYTAKDPMVLGIGYAATRDLNSFLRYSDKDDAGSPNPVANQIRWTMSRGDSQSGNFIRSFINLGFNQDESNRIVWDGAIPHIAARQLAQLPLRHCRRAAGPFQPGSESVLWWSDYEDKTRGRPIAGLLDRCRKSDTCPKIFETFGSLEFWYLRESPDLVGTDAKADIPLPPNVRRYFFPGTSHGGGRGGFSAVAPARRPVALCRPIPTLKRTRWPPCALP